MSNAKQRLTLTNLSEPQQMRELNRQLSWIWDQLLGGLSMKSLNSGTRAVIDSKASSETVDGLGDRIEEISTEVVQTQEEISLKASREELLSVREILDSAQQDVAALDQRVAKNEAEITVQADQIALRVTEERLTAGLDGKLDADAPSVGVATGSGVMINSNGVYVEGKEIDLRTSDGDEYVSISEAGVAASSISAPNVAPMYDGPKDLFIDPTWSDSYLENGMYEKGDCMRSLKDALSALSYKTVPYAVTVYLATSMVEYGNAELAGCVAPHGITIRTESTSASSYATLHGTLSVKNCLATVYIWYMRVNPTAGSHGIHAVGIGSFASAKYVIVRGTGSSSRGYCMCADDGAKLMAVGCEMYDYECSMVSRWGAEFISIDNKGNTPPYIENATMRVHGTAPGPDSSFWWYHYGAIDVIQNGVTVNKGSASGSTAPTLTTAAYPAVSTGSYRDGGSKYRNDVGQGWYDGIGRIRGSMWFDNTAIRSALNGKTIRSATLRLSMRSGVGRGTNVTVELSGTAANSGASGAAVTRSYGVIGTTSPGEVTTITIPNAAISDLVSGAINGFMLYSSDTGAYKEYSYSKNYAIFDGCEDSDSVKPMLTVVYQ